MPSIDLNEDEIVYILNTLAKQKYALERYTEMKGVEERVMQELTMLKKMVEQLSHACPSQGAFTRGDSI
jgi:hypothetical protein